MDIEKIESGVIADAALRVEYDHRGRPHPHASTHFGFLSEADRGQAIRDITRAKQIGAAEINFHIPSEIQFVSMRNEAVGLAFMDFVSDLGRQLEIRVVWENAPLLTPPTWSLVEQTAFIPKGYDLCLDTGHLILGASCREEAVDRIDAFIYEHGAFVRHLHIHINDLVSDQHNNDPVDVITFLGFERFKSLVEGRSYIFEKGL